MELFGLICAVVGAGTLSAGLMRIIAQIDGKKMTAPGGKPDTVGAQINALNENICSIHDTWLTRKGEFDGIKN